MKKITTDSASICKKQKSDYAYLNEMFDEQIKLNEQLVKYLMKFERRVVEKDKSLKTDNNGRRQKL